MSVSRPLASGDFGPEKVTLSLKDLPRHRFVRVSFDLFLIRSWDGSSSYGPDIWELSVEKGQRLIYTTFTNCGYFSSNNAQTFPDNHPMKPHKGWTGAAEKQSLGYQFSYGSPKQYATDGVYRIVVVIPHTDAALKLNFMSHCKDSKGDQSWGLDNVKVKTVESAARLSDEQMESCWAALAGDDPVAAFASVWQMVSSGQQAVSFLDSKIHVAAMKESGEIKSLLKDLGADKYQTRQHATKRLNEFDRRIEPILRKALQATASSETRVRLIAILKKFEAKRNRPAQSLRRQRVERVLQVIDSPQARELRKKYLF